MINSNLNAALVGISEGYKFSTIKRSEIEIKQGQNHTLAAVDQTLQFSQLAGFSALVLDSLPQTTFTTLGKFVCGVAPIYFAFPFCIVAGAIRGGTYQAFVQQYPRYMPKFNPLTCRALSFCADHIGNMTRVATIVNTVALVALGHVYLGAGLLISLTYDMLDSSGYVPRKVSLFIEKYMSVLIVAQSLVAGGWFNYAYLFYSLLRYMSASWDLSFYQKVDKFMPVIPGPRLLAMEEPLMQNKHLNFEQILSILKAKDSDFELNMAHAVKKVIVDIDLPLDTHIEELPALFDKIDWEVRAKLVETKLRTDDRFIDYLKTELSEPREEAGFSQPLFENCLQRLASKKMKTKEALVIDYLKAQFKEFVSVLRGEVRVKGKQEHLDEAISNMHKILAHIKTLNLQNTAERVEYEDIFLKLAIEGGSYCALGLKRTTKEIVAENIMVKHQPPSLGPTGDYEREIEIALQKRRAALLQDTALRIGSVFGKVDIHIVETTRTALSLGFHPLTEKEKKDVDIVDAIFWAWYNQHRLEMYRLYKGSLWSSTREIGAAHFVDYICGQIDANTKLTAAQKETLLEYCGGTKKLIGSSDYAVDTYALSLEEIPARFERLMFVMLGVLKQKS